MTPKRYSRMRFTSSPGVAVLPESVVEHDAPVTCAGLVPHLSADEDLLHLQVQGDCVQDGLVAGLSIFVSEILEFVDQFPAVLTGPHRDRVAVAILAHGGASD